MLRRADNLSIKLQRYGLGKRKGRLLVTQGSAEFTVPLEHPELYEEMRGRQEACPVPIFARRGRQYWWFHEKFYWENDDLTTEQVHALLLERERKQERRIERAMSAMEGAIAKGQPGRERVADEVRLYVWRRDEGRCVRCGSQEKLEFDHVIPVTMGGSNTARNIQLLCERCNREKGGNLA